jgi:hypothetical protein
MQEITQDAVQDEVVTGGIAQASEAIQNDEAIAVEAEAASDTPQDSSEEEARKYGWRPKEEFENPDNWVGAKEFLYRRNLMDKIHNQSRALKRVNEELSTYKRSIDNVEKIITKREELARQQEREAILRERREAIQSGDVEAVERLDEKIFNLNESAAKKAEPEIPPETQDWIKQHQSNWFNKNSVENIEMMEEAARIEKRIYGAAPDTPVADALQMLEKEMRRKYPHRFRNPNLDRKPEVEGTGEYGATKKPKYDQGKITPALSKIAEQFVNKGLFKTKDDYYKVYFGR